MVKDGLDICNELEKCTFLQSKHKACCFSVPVRLTNGTFGAVMLFDDSRFWDETWRAVCKVIASKICLKSSVFWFRSVFNQSFFSSSNDS